MKEATERVGESLRAKYTWVSEDIPIYLVMDNAGGHGTDDAIKEYVTMLKDKYNVIVVFQVPRSPYTNLLDLGVWCSLQSKVEKEHKEKRNDATALAKSVYDTWNNYNKLQDVIGRVWGRLRNVLVLVKEGNGGNDKVETKRGKEFRKFDLPETIPIGTETNAAVGTNINTAIPIALDIDYDYDDVDDEYLDVLVIGNMGIL